MTQNGSFHTWTQTLSAILAIMGVIVVLVQLYPHWNWFFSHQIEAIVGVIFILVTIISGFFIFFTRSGRRLFWFIAVVSVIGLVYIAFMPTRFPNPVEPEVEVRICGSTTLGEDFALQYLDTLSKRNHAASITTKYDTTTSGANLNITVDADFTNVPKNQRMPDFPPEISKVRFNVDAKGTENGFEQLSDKRCNISMASTNIANTKNKKDLENLAEKSIGSDAIAIIVNRQNSNINFLERERLKSIFSSKENSWTVFGRDDASGTTRELIKYLGLSNISGEKVKTNIEMLEKVADKSNAIGYLSYSFLKYKTADVRVVPVKESEQINAEPNPLNIINRRCAMIRKLYLYIPSTSGSKSPETKIANLLYDNASEDIGQAALRNAGFIPTWDTEEHRLPPNNPLPYNIKEIYNKIKSSVLHTVLFSKDSNIPSEQERDNLLQWVDNQPKGESLILIGHADNQGSVRYNKGLSIERAEEISAILKEKRLSVEYTDGLGQQFQESSPVASRRVEIYSLRKLKELTDVAK